MAFSEIERKRHEKLLDTHIRKTRPPPHIRKELDCSYRIDGQSVELLEVRPVWDRPKEIREYPVIRATFVKRSGTWKVYWWRANLRWYRYDPEPEVKTLQEVLDIAERDEYGCFYG